MVSKIVRLKKRPKLNWAVAMCGSEPVQTKQEKYKPLISYSGVLEDTQEIFNNLYINAE